MVVVHEMGNLGPNPTLLAPPTACNPPGAVPPVREQKKQPITLPHGGVAEKCKTPHATMDNDR